MSEILSCCSLRARFTHWHLSIMFNMTLQNCIFSSLDPNEHLFTLYIHLCTLSKNGAELYLQLELPHHQTLATEDYSHLPEVGPGPTHRCSLWQSLCCRQGLDWTKKQSKKYIKWKVHKSRKYILRFFIYILYQFKYTWNRTECNVLVETI